MEPVVYIQHQNPDATIPLTVPVIVAPNTAPTQIDANVRANAALPLPWFMAAEPHDGVAVICGGGPSLAESAAAIKALGGDVFGLNGAAGWLLRHGIDCTQVMIDAQEISSGLVAPARRHLMASHVHPRTIAAAERPTLFHLNFAGLEDMLPAERVEEGGYTLLGGGVSVGITAAVLAYAMGYRTLHFFGYDSSNAGEATHAYPQPHNAAIPTMRVDWAGRSFIASMPMKLQAEAFFRIAEQLREEGCTLHVHGDGLLPAMWNNPPQTEREKYQLLWALGSYRDTAPGEDAVDEFLRVARPDGLIVDFGCGTGRAALRLHGEGFRVLCVDFADNCRDPEARALPFLLADLTQPLPLRGDCGLCTDVMEHIPPEDVDTVLANVMAAAGRCYFQIATVPDEFGATIGARLHLTVRGHSWWRERFAPWRIEWEACEAVHSTFYVTGA